MLGIVLLNFNCEKLILGVVESIASETWVKHVSLCIVDNHSEDGSYQNLCKSMMFYQGKLDYDIVRSSANLGFGRAANIAFSVLQKKFGALPILVLNPDITWTRGEFDPFLGVARLKKTPSIALWGPKIINSKGESENPYLQARPSHVFIKLIWVLFVIRLDRLYYKIRILFVKSKVFGLVKLNLKALVSRLRRIIKRDRRRLESPQSPTNSDVYCLHGAALMFAPSFFFVEQGYPEELFMYGEELVLAEMLYRHGLVSWIDETAGVIVHGPSEGVKIALGKEEAVIRFKVSNTLFGFKKYVDLFLSERIER